RDLTVTGVQTCALPISAEVKLAQKKTKRMDHLARQFDGANFGVGSLQFFHRKNNIRRNELLRIPGGGDPIHQFLQVLRIERRCRSEERRVGKDDRWWSA